jgi:Zn-dependent protease
MCSAYHQFWVLTEKLYYNTILEIAFELLFESNFPCRLSNNNKVGRGAPIEVKNTMFRSLNLGKCFGIDLYIHPTFWLLPLFVLFSDPTSAVSNVLFVFVVFGCIVLHELGHALTARAYGIGTRDITLYPIGGVASLERMPEKPGREIAIALAGPAVNLVIAAALLIGALAGAFLIGPLELENPFIDFAIKVLIANLFLCGFNLLPAFPMDGGRVLRALLATRMPRLRATEIAVQVGTLVAAGFLVYGLIDRQPGLMVLAVAVYLLGQTELAMVRVKEMRGSIHDRLSDFFAPSDEEPVAEPYGPPSPGFSGLAWDATRRVWVEWRNGVRVGALPPR